MELGGREATLKSVYSNGVKPSQFNLVKQHAISKLKFTRVASKATASVHIKNKDLNTSLVIAFIRSGCVAHKFEACICVVCIKRCSHTMMGLCCIAWQKL